MNTDDPAERTARFVQLLTGLQSRLYAYLCTVLARPEEARDVLQETNLMLWKKAAEYDPARPFEPWAFRFAYLQALAWRQRQRRDRLVFDERTFELLAAELAAGPGSERELVALEHCLARLPEPARARLERRYAGGASVSALAEAEGKPPNTIAALLYRARKLLAACLTAALAQEGAA